MTNIFYSPEFRKEIKHLAKKYRSIPEDLIELRTRLMDNPFEGVDLGMGVRKVRMSIKSKGKGKSGGARVITYSLTADVVQGNLLLKGQGAIGLSSLQWKENSEFFIGKLSSL